MLTIEIIFLLTIVIGIIVLLAKNSIVILTVEFSTETTNEISIIALTGEVSIVALTGEVSIVALTGEVSFEG